MTNTQQSYNINIWTGEIQRNERKRMRGIKRKTIGHSQVTISAQNYGPAPLSVLKKSWSVPVRFGNKNIFLWFNMCTMGEFRIIRSQKTLRKNPMVLARILTQATWLAVWCGAAVLYIHTYVCKGYVCMCTIKWSILFFF